MRFVTILLTTVLATTAAVELTVDNFDELTIGKSVFLKFYDPMCGQCIQMEDAWKDLGEAVASSKSKLIGEVDCTSEDAAPLCQQHGVQGFPTLKFGDVFDLQEYEGPRDFESLRKFSNKQLRPICGVYHTQLCDKKTRQEIRKYKQMTLEELDQEINAKTTYLEGLEKFEKEFEEELQRKYDQALKEKEASVKKIRDSGLALMKAVAAAEKIKGSKPTNHDEL